MKNETIYDRAERTDRWAKERELLKAEYNAAKEREDWTACSRAVDKMRTLGGCPR